jgi:hypothetical protein
VPETVINDGELEALLVIEKLPVTLAVLAGVKVTFRVTV